MKKIVALALCLALALALCTVAFAETTYYAAKTTSKITTGTALSAYPEFNVAKDPTLNKDGELTAYGKVAHYAIPATDVGFAGKYVAVASLAEADVVVATDAAMKNVVLYLDEINTEEYANAAVFTNFGEKCGQVNYDYDKDSTYYTLASADGNDYLYVADKKGTANVMVAGKLVAVKGLGVLPTAVKHVATPVIDTKTGKTTGYKCSVCGVAAVEAANIASIPADGQQIGDSVFYFAASAAAAATTGVASAKTFDAGVALYAGMALMSVAGSAVVIGKKKEF